MFCFCTEFRNKIEIKRQSNDFFKEKCSYNFKVNTCELNIHFVRKNVLNSEMVSSTIRLDIVKFL